MRPQTSRPPPIRTSSTTRSLSTAPSSSGRLSTGLSGQRAVAVSAIQHTMPPRNSKPRTSQCSTDSSHWILTTTRALAATLYAKYWLERFAPLVEPARRCSKPLTTTTTTTILDLARRCRPHAARGPLSYRPLSYRYRGAPLRVPTPAALPPSPTPIPAQVVPRHHGSRVRHYRFAAGGAHQPTLPLGSPTPTSPASPQQICSPPPSPLPNHPPTPAPLSSVPKLTPRDHTGTLLTLAYEYYPPLLPTTTAYHCYASRSHQLAAALPLYHLPSPPPCPRRPLRSLCATVQHSVA